MPARSTYAWHAYLHYNGPRYADNTSQRLFLLVDVTIASVQSPVTVYVSYLEVDVQEMLATLPYPLASMLIIVQYIGRYFVCRA